MATTDAEARSHSPRECRLGLEARGPAAATFWVAMDLPAAEGCRKIIEHIEAAIEQFQFSSRLAISDDLRIGFFSTDSATQTEVSEILTIKELTLSTRNLVKIVKSLQVDFTFLKQLLQLQFEDRLKEESSHIFSILSDRIQTLEQERYQNEDVLRMCYKQQLSDAIAVIKAMYKKYFALEEEEMILEKDSIFLKITTLIKRLQEKEEIIQDLKDEIQLYEDTTLQKYDSYLRAPSGSLRNLLLDREFWECKADLEKQTQKAADLQEELEVRIKENANLEFEIMNLKERAEKNQSSIQKLTEGREKLINELENEKLLVQELTVKYKDEMETRKRLSSIGFRTSKTSGDKHFLLGRTSVSRLPSNIVLDSLAALEPTALHLIKKKAKGIKKTLVKEDGWVRTLTDSELRTAWAEDWCGQNKELKKGKGEKEQVHTTAQAKVVSQLTATQEEAKIPDHHVLERQIELLKSSLEIEKKKAERYKREAERISKIWEKKFSVLRNSLHILKNEMFTRHTLYRQFAVLADTSFNYVKAKPLFVQPRSPVHGSESSESEYRYSSLDSRYANEANEQLSNSKVMTSKVTFTFDSTGKLVQSTPVSMEGGILNAESPPKPEDIPVNDDDDDDDDEDEGAYKLF